MMDNERLLNQKPLLLDVDDFVNYLVNYCSSATDNEDDESNRVPSKPNLNVKDVMIKLRKNAKFINFLNRINGQLKANANNELITNHDLLLEMVTDQCKEELIDILKEVIQNADTLNDNDNYDEDEFNPTLLDSIPEEDSEELLSRGSTLNMKQANLYRDKEQQKAVEKWLAASLDNLAVYAQQQNVLTTSTITDSQTTLLPTSKEELDKAILETENNLKLLIEEDEITNQVTSLPNQLIEDENVIKKASVIKMPVFSQETIIIKESPNTQDDTLNKIKNDILNEKQPDLIKIDQQISNDNASSQTIEQAVVVDKNEVISRVKSKEEPTNLNRTSLEVPNTFLRLALSLDEGTSDDENENSNKKKLEKTHSLPEDRFSKEALNDLVESKNQPDPHLTNLDLSQIQQSNLLMQEAVLNSLLQNEKKPKLQYQFASEENLNDNDLNKNLDEQIDLQAVEEDSNLEFDQIDPLQDSIFDNLNLMETIVESFEDDSSVNLILQDQENLILSQQNQLDALQQQLIDEQVNETLLFDEMQQQQQMFANELMELQSEYDKIYSNQQEQYFDNLQSMNQEYLENRLEMLLNQAQQLNLPMNQDELTQNQDNFDRLQSLVEKLSNLSNQPIDDPQQVSISEIDTFQNLKEDENKLKLNQKSLSGSLSEEKEKSTSSDTSAITEILNESILKEQELYESSIKLDDLMTYEDVKLQEQTVEDQILKEQFEDQIIKDQVVKDKSKKQVISSIGYDMRDVEKASFEMQNDEELEEINLDNENKFSQLQEVDDFNLEMIENIANKLEDLVTEAKPPTGKQKSLIQTKFIKPSLMEEIAKTLDDLLTEAKQVLGDNQITLSSQKLNKATKQEVIKNITNTLENLLIIDDQDSITAKQQFATAKNARKNLIQNITKSLGSLLTDEPIEKPLSSFLFRQQQRSFDQEPKLNMIITRSLENLLTLSNPELSGALKKSKRPGVIESITRTLENLFTRSQVETDDQLPIEQCTCQLTLVNKKSEYTSLPVRSAAEIQLSNQKTEYSNNFSIENNNQKSANSLEADIKEVDSVSIKSEDSKSLNEQTGDKPIAPKRSKKLKISQKDQDNLSQKSFEQTSLVTVMSTDIIEEKRVLLPELLPELPELQADISKIEMIQNEQLPKNDELQSPEIEIEILPKNEQQLKYADDKSISIELINEKKLKGFKELNQFKNETQQISDDNLIISEFDQKQIESLDNVIAIKNQDLLKTDYSYAKSIELKDKKQPIVSTLKASDLIKTDLVITIKVLDLIRLDYAYVPIDKDIELEKIEQEEKEEDKKPRKKLKLRMPLFRKESVLIRQSQIEDEDETQNVSDSFDVKLISSDEESSDDAKLIKRKSIDKSKKGSSSNQISEQSDELNLATSERKHSAQSEQSEYAEASDNLIEQFEDDQLREEACVVRKKSVRFPESPFIKDVRLFTPGSR